MKWLNTTKEGSQTIHWIATTPFGVIRICSDGNRAMCVKHPVEEYPDVGTEFESVDEAKKNAESYYNKAVVSAYTDYLDAAFQGSPE